MLSVETANIALDGKLDPPRLQLQNPVIALPIPSIPQRVQNASDGIFREIRSFNSFRR